ncbi:DUF3278 domain-containing protein [Bombilactobacillus bombi]|uniref:DUF3278 domain-containing protein n=1 Tax=Bombilactobacillus bombi TaxID=1303590 RepID=UPI0015E5A862|nr:DUF3278 domain-containing protein [Bombilactobacillus bombi]
MKMSKRDWIVKQVYDIYGPLDEQRRQKVDQVGNNSFLFLYIYFNIASFIALVMGDRYSNDLLIIFSFLNLLVGFVISTYLDFTINSNNLSNLEVNTRQAQQLKLHNRRRGILYILEYSIEFYLIIAFVALGVNVPLLKSLTDFKNIIFAVVYGIIFGLYKVYRKNKKIIPVEDDEQ